MNGHSDVIMGAAVTNNEEIHNKLRFLQNGEQLLFVQLSIFKKFIPKGKLNWLPKNE